MSETVYDITIRDAREEDAEFLGKVILAAAHLTNMSIDTPGTGTYPNTDTNTGTTSPDTTREQALTAICRRSDTLYSWRNARIACVNGKRAGAMVSYSGESYAAARSITFPLFPGVTRAELDATDIETFPGEWYLDSLAVLPEFRKGGIGKCLVMDAIERGRKAGYTRFSLLAEKSSTHLVQYYTRLGFAVESSKLYFGSEYWRMVRGE